MQEKYGFVYIWYDRKHKRYYIGCKWGNENCSYICSSSWMNRSYKRRPEDFKRRILSRVYTTKKDLLQEEYRWLSQIKKEELGKRYYNLHNHHFSHWSSCEEKLLSVSEKIKISHNKPEMKQRFRETKFGEKNPMKRKEVVEKRLETYKKGNHTPWNKGIKTGPNPELSMILRGRPSPNKGTPRTEEQKNKISKKWLVTKPDGTEELVINLNEYCKKNGIIANNMRKVAYGERKTCSGYKCQKL